MSAWAVRWHFLLLLNGHVKDASPYNLHGALHVWRGKPVLCALCAAPTGGLTSRARPPFFIFDEGYKKI